jgi:ABC-type sugar transport system permease subunit
MFDIPALFMGGVNTNMDSQSARTIMTSIEQIAFGSSEMIGLASAMSVVLFLFTASCSILIFVLMGNRGEEKLAKDFAKAEKIRRRRAGGVS